MQEERQRLSETPIPQHLQEYFGDLISEYLAESLMHSSENCTIVVNKDSCWLECGGRLRGAVRSL